MAGAGATVGAALVGGFAWARGEAEHRSGPETGGTVGGAGPLVLVTLYGGNDGLNTVIPAADSAYRAARPTLGYQQSEVLDLGDGLGLNPKLTAMHSLWQSRQLAVVRGVGYPNPSLSHFESMDIWQTANPSDGSGPGWLGRWLDATGDDPMRAISVGATLPPMLRGEKSSATAVVAPTVVLPGSTALQTAFADLQKPGPDRAGMAADVAAAGSDLIEAKGRLDALKGPSNGTAAGSAGTGTAAGSAGLAGQLGVIADLINAGAPARVYQASLSSFDTHSDEKADHERLLGELDSAVAGFMAAIAASPGAGRNAVVMTFSEFGRRPAQNASGGTDHGTAAPLFVAGRTVRGGQFYGEEPSLTALDANGNLVANVDFRSVYATVLGGVVGVDPKSVLGTSFPTLGFI